MFGRLALTLRANGFDPIPIKPNSKAPAVVGWTKAASARVLERWIGDHAASGVGLLCGDIVGIDIDVLDAEASARIEALVMGALGPTPLLRVGQWPKRLMIYRLSERMPSRSLKLPVGGLDILATGRQFVAFGIHPGTGRSYDWSNGDTPISTPIDALPSVSPHQIKNLSEQALSLFFVEHEKPTGEQEERSRSIAVKSSTTGLIVDGRDEHLRALVFEAWRRRPDASPHQIAQRAWAEFEATADTTTPKRNGAGPALWTHAGALEKARYLVNKAARNALKKVTRARLRPHAPGQEIATEAKDAFRRHCQALHEAGQITATELRVSVCMLDRLEQGRCTDSVAYLAAAVRVSAKTVKRARRELLRSGLWSTGRKFGKRDQTAPYFPDPKIMDQVVAKTELMGGVGSKMSPKTIGVVGGAGGDPGYALPPQLHDARQLSLLSPVQTYDELRASLDGWSHGPIPEAVRVAYVAAKRRRALRQEDVARAIGISRPQLANALKGKFGLSAPVAQRLKDWLLADDRTFPKSPATNGAGTARPHHRRGGKRAPDPGPPLPALRLFAVIDGEHESKEAAPLDVRDAA